MGAVVVKELQASHPYHADYRFENEDMMSLIDLWCEKTVVIVDSIHSEEPEEGRFHVFNSIEEMKQADDITFSPQGISIIEAYGMADDLSRLTMDICIIGIEGNLEAETSTMSASIPKIKDLILEKIRPKD